MRLGQDKEAALTLPQGHTAAVIVLHGTVLVNAEVVSEAQMVMVERDGDGLRLQASSDATLLVLSAER